MLEKNSEAQSSERSFDISSIIRDVLKRWIIIAAVSVSAAFLTYSVITMMYVPEYMVSSTFIVNQSGMNVSAQSNLTITYDMAENFSALLENNILKKTVMKELELSEFNAKIKADIVPETNMIKLSVRAGSPKLAFDIMHSVLKNYPELTDYVMPNVIMEIIQQPDISDIPVNRLNIQKYMLYAFLGCALMLIVLTVVFSYLKDTVKNENEFAEKVDSRMLGTIYNEKKAKTVGQMFNSRFQQSMLITNPVLSFSYVEHYRMLASRIKNVLTKKNAKVLLVTSVSENEGKSTVSSNIALALAQEGYRVMLIDGDIRKPALSKIFEKKQGNMRDLVSLLEGNASDAPFLGRIDNTSLYTVFNYHAREDSAELLNNGVMKKLITASRKTMDFIIIDTPPMGVAADAEDIAKMADAALLVVAQNKILTRNINDAIDDLNQNGEKLIGCVFNNVHPPFGEHARSYGYGGYQYRYGNYSKLDR